MRLCTYVILLLSFSFPGKAQNVVPQKADRGFMLHTGFRLALIENKLWSTEKDLKDVPIKMPGTYNLAVYADIYFELNDQITLQTGFSYQPQKLQFQDRSIDFLCEIPLDSTVLVASSYYKYNRRYLYLGIPLAIRYLFPIGNGKFYSRLGLEYLIKLKESEETIHRYCGEDSDITFRETEALNSKNVLKVQLGAGIAFDYLEHHFFVEPTIACSLNPGKQRYAGDYVTINNYFKARFLQFGLMAGVMF